MKAWIVLWCTRCGDGLINTNHDTADEAPDINDVIREHREDCNYYGVYNVE